MKDGDVHHGHTHDGGAALRLNGMDALLGIKALTGKDNRSPVRKSRDHPHDRARTVKEGNGQTNDIKRMQLQPRPHLRAVVEHVVVGERGTLGLARRARGVLDAGSGARAHRGQQRIQARALHPVGLR